MKHLCELVPCIMKPCGVTLEPGSVHLVPTKIDTVHMNMSKILGGLLQMGINFVQTLTGWAGL